MISSALTRNVILLELTCCAEEGVQAAHLRKDTRYAELMVDIAANNWTGRLFTVEIGARGLVGSRTFRTLVTIGFTHREANCLCKSLSEIVARCSYAIYLAHSSVVWPHNKDLVVGKSTEPETKVAEVCLKPEKPKKPAITNVAKLRKHGITHLFHFTDAANVPSIKLHGLMSATLIEKSIQNPR